MDFSKFCIKKWDAFPRIYKCTFFATFLFGLLSHGFAFFNIINNHDNLAITEDWYEFPIQVGRWGESVIGKILKDLGGGVHYIYPVLIGVFTLCMVAISVCLIVDMFQIKSEIAAMLFAGLMAAFPTMTSSFLYMWMAHYMGISVCLSVVGVWIARKWKYGCIFSIFIVAFATGIYQAHVPIVASLFVLLLLTDILDNNNWKKNFLTAIKWFSSLLASLGVYYLIVRISLRVGGVELSDYKGISNMASTPIGERLAMVKVAYKLFLRLPSVEYASVNHTLILRTVFFISIASTAIFIAYLLYRKKLSWLSNVLAVVYAVMFPLAVNSIVLMTDISNIYGMMVYSVVLVLFAPLMFLDKINQGSTEVNSKRSFLLNSLLSMVMLIGIMDYAWQANGNYTALWYANEQAKSYFTTMVTEIKSTEGYREVYPIAFIGVDILDEAYKNAEWDELYFRYVGNPSDLLNIYTRKQLIKKYTGFTLYEIPKEELSYWQGREDVKNMPCYPDDGSIKIIEDVIVIKLNDYFYKNTPY